MKQVYLKCNLAMCKRDTVSAMLKRFDTLIRSTDGVLSGNIIWNKIFHSLNIDAGKEILEAFGIHNLCDKIYGIKSVDLYRDPRNDRVLLLFKIKDEDSNERSVDASEATGAFRNIFEELKSIQERTGVKIAATVTTDGVNIKSSKDNLVYRIIIPKQELDNTVDIKMVLADALTTAVKKMMD